MGMGVTRTSEHQARHAAELPAAAPWRSQEPHPSGYTVLGMSGISLTYLFYDFRWRQGLGMGGLPGLWLFHLWFRSVFQSWQRRRLLGSIDFYRWGKIFAHIPNCNEGCLEANLANWIITTGYRSLRAVWFFSMGDYGNLQPRLAEVLL